MNIKAPFARKRFGQHFLSDETYLQRFIDALDAKLSDTLIEIGPGRGALTFPLLKRIGKLIAIEIDRDLCTLLKAQIPAGTSLNLLCLDVLKADFKTLFPEHTLPLRIIGNLPYNISTPLLFHLLEYKERIQDIHVMLQKEVVDRLAAKPGSKIYGRLSVMMQYACSVEPLWSLPPGAFNPPPQVSSMVVRLKPYATLPYVAEDFARFSLIVRTAFSHKRKMLQTSLATMIPSDAFQALEIDPKRRPETLSVAEFVQLSNWTVPP